MNDKNNKKEREEEVPTLNSEEKEVLADYISGEGEHIKVVSGVFVRNGSRFGRLNSFSDSCTIIYVNNKRIVVYREDDLPMGKIPYVKDKIKRLVEGRADSEEVIYSIDTIVADLSEQEKIEEDDPEAFIGEDSL